MAQTAPTSIPTIEQPLVPTEAQPGGAGFTLTINGTGFVPTPTDVLFGGTKLTITSSTATQLKVTVPMASIAAAGTASVSVQSLIDGEIPVASNVEFFQIATPASPQFAGPPFYGTGGTVESVLAADFRGIGILDLAVGVSNDPSQVCIMLGSSNGTFQTPTCYQVDNPSSMVAAVFNRNGGFVDIAVGDNLLVGAGNGTFTVTALNPEGFIPYAVGDFSQTGTLDLAGTSDGGVQILNNDDTGQFTEGQFFSGSITQFGSMVTADFNGDGILDLAVLDIYGGAPAVRVYLGSTGTAGFNTNPVSTITQVGAVSFTAADFNGDGKPDLAIAFGTDYANAVSILLGNGDGTFTSGAGFTLNFPNGPIVTADFNEDGKLDLATGAAVVLGNGDGTFQTPIYFEGDASQEILATGDFNGDGRPDLVTLGDSGIYVYLQQAPAGLPAVTLAPSTLTFSTQIVGTTSAVQAVTLTNSGSAALTITSIGLTGANEAEFAQTNTCPAAPATLAAGSNCTISVTFTPTAAGTAAASISIADNATGSPQTVPITGTAPFLTTSCTSLTVVPGQTAIFTVDLTPVNGLTPTVSLSCSGAPALATCTVAPSSMTLDGSTTVQAMVTATTTQASRSLKPPFGGTDGNRMPVLFALVEVIGFAAAVMLLGKRRAKPGRVCSAILSLCLLSTIAILPSCGGGDPPGTSAGTYPLTVTGSFQSATGNPVTEQVSFNLIVQ